MADPTWRATAAAPRGLRGLSLLGPDGDPAPHGLENPAFAEPLRQLAQYFRGARTAFDLPLDPLGTPFQRQVWASLRAIPFGSTQSYSQQAAALGRPSAARALASACSRNPLAIVLPCHRVVAAHGALAGYRWGLAAKSWLLAHEARGAPKASS